MTLKLSVECQSILLIRRQTRFNIIYECDISLVSEFDLFFYDLLFKNRKILVARKGLKKGDDALKKKQIFLAAIKMFHSCLENAPQTVLQQYIIITTWGNTGKHKKYVDEMITFK